MNKYERKILKDLYESDNGLHAFTLYSRYKIEPSELFVFIEEYSKKGILHFENNKIELTKEGKNILVHQMVMVKPGGNKYSNVPQEFIGEKIEINSPYLPNIENISADILKKMKVV